MGVGLGSGVRNVLLLEFDHREKEKQLTVFKPKKKKKGGGDFLGGHWDSPQNGKNPGRNPGGGARGLGNWNISQT